jgi:hypothetical protein
MTTTPATTFVVQTESGVHRGTCILGEAATERAAWEDAFGPRPWSPSTRRAARNAWVSEMTEEQLNDVREDNYLRN